jgi:C4-dicarboxylate transporter DctM subunit
VIATIVIVFVLFSLTGMPIAFALGLAGLAGIIAGGFPMIQLAGKVVHSIDNFPLMSIPLFMLAGQLMMRGGIMTRLIDFANAFVGRVRGGLGHVTVLTAMGLSSVSGTAVADATALGGTLGPALSKAYGRPFSAALVASASNLGPIIPPSAGMILYAFLAEDVNIGALFISGILPGVFLGFATMGLCTWFAYRRNFPISETPFSLRNLAVQTWRTFPIFMMPILVLGGIIGGIFTATEGAAIAVAYALVLGFFVTRKLKLSDIAPSLLNAAIVTAIVGALIAFASQVTYLFTAEMVGVAIAQWLQSLTTNPADVRAAGDGAAPAGWHSDRGQCLVHHAGADPCADRQGVRHRPHLFRTAVRVQHHARRHHAAGRWATVRGLRDMAREHERDDARPHALHHPAVRGAVRLHAVSGNRAVPAETRWLLNPQNDDGFLFETV